MVSKKEMMARILPCPKNIKILENEELHLAYGERFCMSDAVPTTKTTDIAKRMLVDYLKLHCGAECLSGDENDIALEIKMDDAPEVCEGNEEGYSIHISKKSIVIVGFGEVGLLYGIITFCKLFRWESDGATISALDILDWPEKKMRGLLIESRYGSNVMEQEDWLTMIDDVLQKKLNTLYINLYGCWCVQYDGRVSEYLYFPMEKHPELETPMVVKYYSPEKQAWIEYEKLPPMFHENFFGELVSYAKERGITIVPAWNSFGHNTLIPARIPKVSAKEADGTPTLTGFCTAEEETYDILFSVYDQIVDQILLPNGLTTFCIGMDEVEDGLGLNAEDVFKSRSPWCKCEKCKDKDRVDIFIEHVIRLALHLKEKGIQTITMYGDMLLDPETHPRATGLDCADRVMDAIEKAGLKENMLIEWWNYQDVRERLQFQNLRPELGLRCFVTPWTGYYSWSVLTHPLRNIQMLAEMAHRDNAEGMIAYSSWDRSYDRAFDAVSEYSWGFEDAGTVQDVTDRYALRCFGKHASKALRAIKLMDLLTEQRTGSLSNPDATVINNFAWVCHDLNYYIYTYVVNGKPYPREFPGEALGELLRYRTAHERMLYEMMTMSKEAMHIFTELAEEEHCDREMARRFAYECQNYLCIAEDWLAILRIYDLSKEEGWEEIAQIADERQQARVQLMMCCEQVKEKYIVTGLAMRNHSISMQMFSDIASYVRETESPQLNMLATNAIMSERFWYLR